MRTIRKLIMRGNWSDTTTSNDCHNNTRHTAANNKTNVDDTINTIINIEEANTNLSESIANRNILLLASTAKSSSSSSDTTSEEMRVLKETMMHQQCEISSMKNRIATLEKKLGGIRDDTMEGGSDNNNGDNIDDTTKHTSADSIYNEGNTEELVLVKEEKDAAAAVTQPTFLSKTEPIRSTTHRGGVRDNDNTQPNDFKDKDNRSDIIIKEEEGHENNNMMDTDIVEEKETMDFIEHPIEEPVLTSTTNNGKKNDKVKQHKKKKKKGKIGRRRHRYCPSNKGNQTTSSVFTADDSYSTPAGTAYRLVTATIFFVNTVVSLLIMRGGKRLHMLAIVSVVYWWKRGNIGSIINSVDNIDKISSSDSSGGSSSSFINFVRALQDCPEKYAGHSSYDIGSQITIAETVYECTKSPCGWKVIGTCTEDNNVFLPLSSSSQEPSAKSEMIIIPSMMPSDSQLGDSAVDSSQSNLFAADSDPTNLSYSESGTTTNSPTYNPTLYSPPTSCQDSTVVNTVSSDCPWDDLPPNIQEALELLEWSQTEWDKGEDRWVPTEDQYWSELTSEQQAAATVLGYDEETWNNEYDSYSPTLPPTMSLHPTNSAVPTTFPSSSFVPTYSSFPTSRPSLSSRPTTSAEPTASTSPTIKPECEASNPEVCGCGSVKQKDYRGTMNSVKGGECARWDIEHSWYKPKDNPNSGLEGNYCRNPDGDDIRAYCNAVDGGLEYCDVPYCFPQSTSCPLSNADNTGSMSEELQAACDYWQCVDELGQSGPDLKLNDSPVFKPTDIKLGCQCQYQVWDCQFGSMRCTANNCCANKISNQNWTTKAASCECTIKPECEAANLDKCKEYAEHCCDEDDNLCKCEYQTKACHLMIESDTEEAYDYCTGVSNTCCGEDNDNICKCDYWHELCGAYPNADADPCIQTSKSCCAFNACKCDLYTHAVELLGYEDKFKSVYATCIWASDEAAPDQATERKALESIYIETEGINWITKTDWTSSPDHCDWFGITCDEDGYVAEIILPRNNLTGDIPSNKLAKFYKLNMLDLSGNSLDGIMAVTSGDASQFFNLRELTHVDLSQNNLSGEVDVLFAPALQHANFSLNNFSSIISFKKFKQSHQTLVVCDVGHNNIKQDVGDIMMNVPPNIEQLILSHNKIYGSLPSPLEHLSNLRRFDISSNTLSGELADLSTSYPSLQVLDLSDQSFTGSIPESLVNLPFLSTLKLAGNQLSSTIPPVLGTFARLKVLDLSNNKLSRSIPNELGKLGSDLEIFNLSANELTGQIPVELVNLQGASVHLSGNYEVSGPAPLDLCFHPGFDLGHNISLCPVERNALKNFYDASKGVEWTTSANWVDPYTSHCDWYGILDCKNGAVTKLNLANNGLSGTLSKSIANLTSLEVLDLSDNDIKGMVPSEIGQLSNLTQLRFSYNAFMGTAPDELSNLMHLELVQIHGNRISGTIPELIVSSSDFCGQLLMPDASKEEKQACLSSSFSSDCGNPSDFEQSLNCTKCTMCCNAQGDCFPQEDNPIMKVGFTDYMQFSWVFIACLVGASCILAVAVFAYDKYQNRDVPIRSLRRESTLSRDDKYALSSLGAGSVYQFFLGTSIPGWIIVLLTLAVQMGMLFIFVDGAEIDLSKDNVDLVYSWKCTRDDIECSDTSDLDWKGWTVFGILMGAHLLKDLISGMKMIVLSAKLRHEPHTRGRYFVGGTLMATVISFILYVSTIYNAAIATSNTEIIENSVIILFIMDIDELFYDILMVINVDWIKCMSIEIDDDDERQSRVVQRMEIKLQNHEKTIEVLNQNCRVQTETIELMMQYIPELKKKKLHATVLPRDDDDSYDDDKDDDLPSTV